MVECFNVYRTQRWLPPAIMFVGLALCLSGYTTTAQNFNDPGPYNTSSYNKDVTFIVPATGKQYTVTVTLTFPTTASEPVPLVFAFNGFECQASWYVGTVTRVASWGYFVMQYTVGNLIIGATLGEDVEFTFVQPLLDWLAAETAPGSGNPSAGLVDLSRKAVLGHSRGGKLATLQYASRSDISTAVLLDPVDCTPFASGPSHPSAVAAMGGGEAICGSTLPPLTPSTKTAAVIGAGYVATVPCNPPSSNYEHFAAVLGAGTWKILIPKAGHMQFPDPSSFDALYSLIALQCGNGGIKTPDVVEDASTIAVAWLQNTFRPDQSTGQLQAFQKWIQALQTAGTVSFDEATADAIAAAAGEVNVATAW